jgi:molybdopterin molybdotransferase
MLTYDEALARILDTVSGPLPHVTVSINTSQASGRVLAEDIIAGFPLPPFDNSAVDGFAVREEDARAATRQSPVALRITQTIAAGYAPEKSVGVGEATRIFTGAPLPDGADAILMVEDTATEKDTVFLYERPSSSFIRRAGSDVQQGTLVLPAGAVLDAGSIGLVASLNRGHVSVYRPPLISILSTGDELVTPGSGEMLQPGQIYESNAPALKAAITAAGGRAGLTAREDDDPDSIHRMLENMRNNDIIISSGGVSVGDRDFVKSVVEEHGELNFWRVAIKPGKPLAFGRYGNALFFGLPGNPVSSLVTFELFVRPVIRKLAGFQDVTRPMVSAILDEPLSHEPGRREFVRARLTWQDDTYHATTTGAQGSHRLRSLLGADAFLIAHEDRGDYAAGERLPTMLLR